MERKTMLSFIYYLSEEYGVSPTYVAFAINKHGLDVKAIEEEILDRYAD